MPKRKVPSFEDGDPSAPGQPVSEAETDFLELAQANQILRALPPADLESLAPKLEHVDFKIDTAFFHQQDPVDHVYFPTSGIVSLVKLLEDGTTVEVAVIGAEGMVGVSAVMGAKFEANEALAQSDGQTLKISAADLRIHFNQSAAMREVMLRFAHNLLIQVSQNAACSRAHTVEQRLARWLLLTHDRLIKDHFVFTQEFMSRMLGVRRAGVSVAANTLRQAGLIDYSRGGITINDRQGLEASACECYRTIESQRTPLTLFPTKLSETLHTL